MIDPDVVDYSAGVAMVSSRRSIPVDFSIPILSFHSDFRFSMTSASREYTTEKRNIHFDGQQ
jgi:hypothetical protein